jgi:site-specific DNA recombinase
MTKNAVIYTRVSLDVTGEGSSVARQEEACRVVAAARGLEVVEVCCDNSISAWSGKRRPGLERALAMAEAGQVDTIIVWALDRLTRSMVDLENIIVLAERTRVGIVTATGDIDLTTDVGRMVARILAAVARQEVERKAARQRLANAQRAKAGGRTTGVRPFGYEQDQMTLRPKEAEAIKRAAKDAILGVPIAQIARQWETEGFISSRAELGDGTGWSTTGVRSILVNPRYAGLRYYLGELAGDASWPAIVDQETHLALVAMLTDANRRTRIAQTGRAETLLGGIGRCGMCGGPLTGSRKHNGVEGYSCRLGRCVTATRSMVDARVTAVVLARLERPDALSLLAPSDDGRVAKDREEAATLRQRLDSLAEVFATGAISRSQLTAGTVRMRERLAVVDARLSRAGSGALLVGLAGSGDVAQRWQEAPLARQRAVVAALLDVRVLGPGRGIKVYDPLTRVLLEWRV